jgi:hypothetical protein
MSVIQIPLRYSDEVVGIDINNLPPLNDLMDVLITELAPLNIWIKLSVKQF